MLKVNTKMKTVRTCSMTWSGEVQDHSPNSGFSVPSPRRLISSSFPVNFRRNLRKHNIYKPVIKWLCLSVGNTHHFCAWPFQSDPHRTLSFSLTSGGKSYVIQWGAYFQQKGRRRRKGILVSKHIVEIHLRFKKKKKKVKTSATISAEWTPVSSLSSLMTATLGSSPSSIPPYQHQQHARFYI